MNKIKNEPKIIAHRGEQNEAPPNTIAAFLLAAKRNYWGVEIDVQKTADGRYICIHGPNIKSMTNGSGRTTKLTLAEIRNFNINSGEKYYKYNNLKIPTLEEALETMRRFAIVPVLDLKFNTLEADDAVKILKEVEEFGMLERTIFTTMSRRLVEALRSVSNTANIQYSVFHFGKKDLIYCAKYDCDISAMLITESRMHQAQDLGMKVNTWTLSHKPKIRLSHKKMEADFVTCNIRDLAR